MKKILVVVFVLILTFLCSCKAQEISNVDSDTQTGAPVSTVSENSESTQKNTEAPVSSEVDAPESAQNVSDTSSIPVSSTVEPTNENSIEYTLAFSNVDNNVNKVAKNVFLVIDYDDYLAKLNTYFFSENGKADYEKYALDKKYSAEYFKDKALILCDFGYESGPIEVNITSVVKNTDSKKLTVCYNDIIGTQEKDGTIRANAVLTSYKNIIEISAEDAKDILEIGAERVKAK